VCCCITLVVVLLTGCVPKRGLRDRVSPDLRHPRLTQTFVYQASDLDSKTTCRTLALVKVQGLLLQEVITLVEVTPTILHTQLSRDQLITLAAGAVVPEIVQEQWNGSTYMLQARLTVTPQKVVEVLERLHRDRYLIEILHDMRRRTDDTLALMARLRQEYVSAPNALEAVRLEKSYRTQGQTLAALLWFTKGVAYTNARNHIDALMAFSAVTELLPQEAEAYSRRAAIYHALEQPQQALEDFSQALELRPKQAQYYAGRGSVYADIDKSEQALADFSRAIELDPQMAVAYYNRATVYSKMGDYEQALADFSRAIELDPEDAGAYNNRGVLYSLIDNYEQALQDFTRAITLRPQEAKAYYNRGTALEKLGKYTQAIQDFSTALELDAQLTGVYFHRGRSYYEVGEYEPALQDYTRAIELNADLVEAHYGLARAYQQLGNSQQAVVNYHLAAEQGLKTVIQEAQTHLKDAGFDPGPMDGVRGPRTQAAIQKYQKARGLPVTGELDEATLQGLFIDKTPPASP
jgi:tetratricopeptide (TPR) repeat protein